MLIKSRIKKIERIAFSVFLFLLFSFNSFAQCAMCRAALGGEENKAKAEAINDGIVYLMVIPYILVGALGYYVYWMKKRKS